MSPLDTTDYTALQEYVNDVANVVSFWPPRGMKAPWDVVDSKELALMDYDERTLVRAQLLAEGLGLAPALRIPR